MRGCLLDLVDTYCILTSSRFFRPNSSLLRSIIYDPTSSPTLPIDALYWPSLFMNHLLPFSSIKGHLLGWIDNNLIFINCLIYVLSILVIPLATITSLLTGIFYWPTYIAHDQISSINALSFYPQYNLPLLLVDALISYPSHIVILAKHFVCIGSLFIINCRIFWPINSCQPYKCLIEILLRFH